MSVTDAPVGTGRIERARYPAPVGTIPDVPWADLMRRMDWRQGEHVTLIGPTGSGKTTLIRDLLPMRDYVIVLATKRQDDTLDSIRADGFQPMEYPQTWAPREIIYPPFPRDPDAMFRAHRATFRRALNEAYQAGQWCVVADEVRYLVKDLGLEKDLQRLWLQGRSLGVSLVAATQRPRHIPLEAYDQPTHLFLWSDSDHGNIRRLSELAGNVDVPTVQRTVRTLPRHDFLYVNTRTGDTAISNVRS